MNTYNQIALSQAMIQNNVWTTIALSKCNNNPHRTTSKEGGMYVCGGMLLLVVIAFVATCIIIRKS